MNFVHQKQLILDDEKPQIIIPIVCCTDEDIVREANEIAALDVFGLEWRLDCYEHSDDRFALMKVLEKLASILKHKVFIVTLRTSDEGGQADLVDNEYVSLYQFVIESGYVDMVDFEVQRIKRLTSDLVTFAKHHDVGIILSYHNFYKVPDQHALEGLIQTMQAYQPTLYKLALMPKDVHDVVRFYHMSQAFHEQLQSPMLMILMGKLGMSTRYQPSVYHSCLTFASLHSKSAPGQIAYAELQTLLTIFHNLS